MTRAVILHGRPGRDEYFTDKHPSASNSHWLPWLQNQLLIAGYDAHTPEMINAFQPEYDIWKIEFERYLDDESMVFVGHSAGGGFLVRWLSENPRNHADKLFLVAPWLDPDDTLGNDFFAFDIDGELAKRVARIHIFASTDDDEDITHSISTIQSKLADVVVHQYEDMGHFCLENMGTDAFPDLLSAITDAG